MERKYKSHTIVITSWGRLEPDGFRPEVRISTITANLLKTLKMNETFPTKKEAETYALQVAQRWIDDTQS